VIEVRYVVTHKGVEKLTTTDKKEADQYDKMLDIGDNIVQLLVQQGISADDALLEDIGIALSQNKAALQEVLRGRPLPAIEEAQDA
jgi:uncharacterized protein